MGNNLLSAKATLPVYDRNNLVDLPLYFQTSVIT